MIDALIAAIDSSLGPQPPARLGAAVSGGGDSIALLSALAQYSRTRGIDLFAVTVDHRLRPEAREEIRMVTALCHKLGLEHHVEYWSGWDGDGNLQAEARKARYALMADWAYANQITHVALGHTADDQAETLLMRLARAGGVDGLSAMAPRRVRHGITWFRPFLDVQRAALRTFLREAGLSWAEDPSNENRDFKRIRARDVLSALEPLGIGVDALCHVAEHMAEAREALDWQTFLAAQEAAWVLFGAVAVDIRRFRTLPAEIRRRLLVHSITWISGSDYPPRRSAVAGALEAIRKGETMTLDGCQISVGESVVWIYRELNAIRDVTAEVGDVWDDRWTVDGPEDDPEIEVSALGFEALSRLEGWRELGLPRAALAVTPAVWYGGELVAAPVVEMDGEWTAEMENGQDAYYAALLSH